MKIPTMKELNKNSFSYNCCLKGRLAKVIEIQFIKLNKRLDKRIAKFKKEANEDGKML